MAKEQLSSGPGGDGVRLVADRLHSTAIHLLRRLRKVDEASGLTAARLSALSVLVFGGPTTVGELARAEQVSAPTMSKLVRGLEADGLVTRHSGEGDARLVLVRPTAKGKRILERGRERRVAELVGLLNALPAAELETVRGATEILAQILALPPSATSAYAAPTTERRWSD